uniref:RNA-dependent RNA polymerase n=1 Tax=Mitovirus 1 BEG47 TaxID=2588361 RepID=A0A6B7HM50_9VIRU|nr:RNA-dependent RNA polymerase [Mitovirus 1 BEG47]
MFYQMVHTLPLNIWTKPTNFRSSTLKRMDTAFAAILLLVKLSNYPFINEFVGLLNAQYTKIVTWTYSEPDVFAYTMRFSLAWFTHTMRGIPGLEAVALALTESDIHPSQLPSSDREPQILADIVEFRSRMKEKHGLKAYRFICVITTAVLSLHRLMATVQAPNYDAITKPGTPPPLGSTAAVTNISELLGRLGITSSDFKAEYKRRCRAQAHILMSTSGPNGPATWTAHNDAKALLGDTKVWSAYQAFAEESGMTRFVSDCLGTVSLPTHDTVQSESLSSGRIHVVEEWGGKHRNVAILDYWTQLILTPLHDTIFHFLSKIEADGTFDQDALATRVCNYTRPGSPDVYSFDLTKATDRLPAQLQEEVLTALLGQSLARAWRTLLTARAYSVGPNKEVKYAVGQPMGAKSSWAMLALTHHVIVQSAARSASLESYTDYGLLGDDITLTDSTVAKNYQAIIAHYGVEINLSKSMLPREGALPAAEICKRVFIDGQEVTSLPVKLITKTAQNGRLCATLQNELHKRDFDMEKGKIMPWFAGLTDEESYGFLLIINSLPPSISGLLNHEKVPVHLSDFSQWYKDFSLKEADVVNAFVYTAVTEQLNRLDILLKQTQVIAAAIETNALGYTSQDTGTLGWQYTDPQHDVKKIAASMPSLNISHPVVKVANQEMERIGTLLAKLRLGDKETMQRARAGLLDMFRNSLVDSWASKDDARAQGDRSLVQRSLQLLTSMVEWRKDHHVSYTVLLAHLNRLWTVDWKLGQEVRINSVKSKILDTAESAITQGSAVETSISIQSMFHTPARLSKAERKARVLDRLAKH